MAAKQNLPMLPLLLFFLLSTELFIITRSQTPDEEKRTLLQIKQSLGNPAALSSWNNSTTTPHCNWTGIECNGGDFVKLVNFSNMDISTEIPPVICDLQRLSFLDFYNNSIPGSFPTALYKCSNLQYLDLSQNYLVGVLPSDIDNMSSGITTLVLSGNNFTGDIPSSIGELQSLTHLYLDYNLFDGTVPEELGKLSNLEVLWLNNNPFAPSNIPASFGNLKNLTYLFMRQANLIGEIPESMTGLSELEHLDLDMNSLTGAIPAGIWMLEKLKFLYLYKNSLSGEINGTIGALSLVEIDVSMNQLTGTIPTGFGELKNLTVLLLYMNRLTGEIPPNIANLPKLDDIRLFNNRLTGVLPAELGKFSPLYNLEVDDNFLYGELPEWLCNNRRFESLVVFNNNFTGNIPATLGDCSTLSNIQVHKNNFAGELPVGIWSAVNLTFVLANDNSLSGELPDKLPWNLTRLEIGNNRFSGSVPLSGGNLVVFKASNNSFSGEISSLSGLSKLQVLQLDGNQIVGKIPEDIKTLQSLTDLNLRSNNINGEIPDSIGSLPVLTTLDLSENQLTGSIPASIGNRLNFLNLSSNQLSGEIPYQLQNQVFEQSFLSNPFLCSQNSLLNLRSCNPRSPTSSGGVSRTARNAFLIAGAALFILTTTFAALIARDYHRSKKTRSKDFNLTSWELTPLQKVNFDKEKIVLGIREQENLIDSDTSSTGRVYKISGGIRGGDVAVKKISTNGGDMINEKLKKEFESEVSILGSVKHNNIVKLLCFITSENLDCLLLVYEFMRNGSLDQWLHGPIKAQQGLVKLEWATRLSIAIGAARGLSYMHRECSRPVVHRDVKSSNILLDSEFRAKIADFGLARMLDKSGEPDTVTAFAGSFGYMAPEMGYTRKVNEKVDVYSFGVVLLELVTGRKASEGGEHGGLVEWAWKHVQEDRKVLDALDKDINDDFNQDCMAKVFKLGLLCTGTLPSTRPTMKEVLQILLSCERSFGVQPSKSYSEKDELPLLQNFKGSRRKRRSDSGQEDDDSNGLDSIV